MSSIYDYTLSVQTRRITPPSKRLPNWLAFFGVFDYVLQRLHDLFFNSYADGDTSTDWISGGTYNYQDRVRDIDNAIYELITIAGVTGLTTNPKDDTTNWIKVLNVFIGARERVKYTSSKISIEYALNRYFKVGNPSIPFTGASHTTQIWISNANNPQTNFWLSQGGPNSLTSYMSNNNSNQRFFLGDSYSYDPYSFTIHVPVAVFTALGPDTATRDGVIRAQADKYVQCGKNYTIVTY